MMLELLKKNRSYRGFDPSHKVTREELEYFAECARYAPTSYNGQAIKFYLACDEKPVADILPLTGWAKRMPDANLPHPGKEPTAFVVICLDKNISDSIPLFMRDASIAAHTMLLAAAERGLGGCIIGTIQAKNLQKVLELPATMAPLLVVAIGKPDETVVITDAQPGQSVDYYRDAQDVHYVPKRTLDELIINH